MTGPEVVELVDMLAWPVALVIIIVALRKPIGQCLGMLIDRIF